MEKVDIQHVTTCAFLFLNEFWYACDFGQREINGLRRPRKGLVSTAFKNGGRTLLDDEIQTLCCLPPVSSYMTPRNPLTRSRKSIKGDE